jgi:predicted nucleic acid-binding Zn ribbon protein
MKRLSEVLGTAFADADVPNAARANMIMRNWDSAVGGILAQHSTPDRYDHGVLWVQANGSAWAQEIRMSQSIILDRLNDLAGEPLFHEIRVLHRARRPEMLR